MIWEKLSDEFITEENSVQSVSILFIDICDETSCESSWVNAIELVVEEFLSSEFTWLLKVVLMSILFCEWTVRVKISSALLFDEVVLSVVFNCEWVDEDCKTFSISRPFSESRRICVWRTSMILRFMLSFSSEFDSFSKLLRERSN